MTDRKLIARARYLRRYARHKPTPTLSKDPPYCAPIPALTIRGFPGYMAQIVRMQFGDAKRVAVRRVIKGRLAIIYRMRSLWGHGRYQHATKSGPGRRPIARLSRVKPAGNKLSRKVTESSLSTRYSDLMTRRLES